ASLSRTQFYIDSKLAPNQFSVLHADATALPFPAQRFDAVYASGVLHHIEDWPKAVAEISRVLKPGGLFYGWEFYKPLLENALFQSFFPHPAHRFTHNELLEALKTNHLTPLSHRTFTPASGMMVAQKNAPSASPSYD
ncbi:MAG: class I SAM-dependent methyltransferase, partial [Alphaproteobacteria bacterium]